MSSYTRPDIFTPNYGRAPSEYERREQFFREEEVKAKLRYQMFLRGQIPSPSL
jgi:hypothetical protein